jgi:hypothetical protein
MFRRTHVAAFVLLGLTGFLLAMIELNFREYQDAALQSQKSDVNPVFWILAGVAPFISYCLLRFLLVNPKNIYFFRWCFDAVICVAIGLALGHGLVWQEWKVLGLDGLQFLVGISGHLACRDLRHRDDWSFQRGVVFQFRSRMRWFIETWFFAVLVGLANGIVGNLFLQLLTKKTWFVIVGTGISAAIGVFIGIVVARFVRWRQGTEKGAEKAPVKAGKE